MTTKLFEKTGKNLFAKHLEQYAPVDPLYEHYTDGQGKQRRKKRELPLGLSKRDMKILRSVKHRAHYLDKGFSICGFRFGWTFFIGIIPGAGDAANVALNYLLVVRKARQAEIPGWLLRRMLMNNAVSAAVGFVPIVGDVVVAMWKANSRNAALLEEFLRVRGDEFLKMQAEAQAAAKEGSVTLKKEVKKSDSAQVKPGAGRADGEAITTGGSTTPLALDPGKAGGESPGLPSAGSSGNDTTVSAMSTGRRSFKSWMKRKAPAAGERGRFVENVDSTFNASEGSKIPKN
ncbi:uncharacterized protein BT62DRAFT_951854 [Guyanagaster necrorhizus]|uniref:Uncharacterized protein n=1 Tax=Guyanagaster necrorhizus TaxID=856835 RepID=A0A9P7VP43_9AGAR|nr:uncharacterized protein BT62DRAFT_951854 [Guyanagaster necrorhizus MCA 3950]KAG7444796.1 hypothetical protein BT62DRAFT_951854 [Guyanagaster necrorhizus MCA 3950]